MADEIIAELRAIKDGIARDHGYDIDALVEHLRKKAKTAGRQRVDLTGQKAGARRPPSATKADHS